MAVVTTSWTGPIRPELCNLNASLMLPDLGNTDNAY